MNNLFGLGRLTAGGRRAAIFVVLVAATLPAPARAQTDAQKKAEYVTSVVRGGGYMSWQEHGLSTAEIDFRNQMEQRKTTLLSTRAPFTAPTLMSESDRQRALNNIASAAWAKSRYDSDKAAADYIVGRPANYVDNMIPTLTPWHYYGSTCPNCVGTKSQEGNGQIVSWSYSTPDQFKCSFCGHVFPSATYPENQLLQAPRMGQTFSFYLNADEQAHNSNRTGTYAWEWVGHKMHMSFTGIVRQQKVSFMVGRLGPLSNTYFLTRDPKYARATIKILVRLANCYRNWLYHDYWDAIADADPLYVAWHDMNLELVWKKHLSESVFSGDSLHNADMEQNFWGGGRIFPSTDNLSLLYDVGRAYDLVAAAVDEQGNSLWTPADRTKVERDLLLEWLFTGEFYLGGIGHADLHNNKTPRIYHAMATAARVLNIPEFGDTALKGYEGLRDLSFKYDGFSTESPAYNNMYLGEMLLIPERLYGFQWPKSSPRYGMTDIYETDTRLKLMYRAVLDLLLPTGKQPPLSDTQVGAGNTRDIIQIGMKRYPEYYAGKGATLLSGTPDEYALFNLEANSFDAAGAVNPPEIYFPAWMTAFLRHGTGTGAATLVMANNPYGGHRHHDNLQLFYADGAQTSLADLGYVSDMPVNTWIKTTFSHNLVVVDDKEQAFSGRKPALKMMFSTPQVSAVEMSTDAYTQATEYRRMVALVKGPGNKTFAVDIFRVKGGAKHTYRLTSELAANDVSGGLRRFTGITMPTEPAVPNFGASIETQHIYGLLNSVSNTTPPAAWQASWEQSGKAYRFWCLSPAHQVVASNGPGQEYRDVPGRRVRVLDVVRQGTGVQSIFVGLHEPSVNGALTSIQSARKLNVPVGAGPDAVAIEVVTVWGTYLIFSEFAAEAQVGGVRFAGKFGIHYTPVGASAVPWAVACGASTLKAGDLGFENRTAMWSDTIATHTTQRIVAGAGRPADWPRQVAGARTWLLVNDGEYETGFPVLEDDAQSVTVDRFPLPAGTKTTFKVPALRAMIPGWTRAGGGWVVYE